MSPILRLHRLETEKFPHFEHRSARLGLRHTLAFSCLEFAVFSVCMVAFWNMYVIWNSWKLYHKYIWTAPQHKPWRCTHRERSSSWFVYQQTECDIWFLMGPHKTNTICWIVLANRIIRCIYNVSSVLQAYRTNGPVKGGITTSMHGHNLDSVPLIITSDKQTTIKDRQTNKQKEMEGWTEDTHRWQMDRQH